MAQDRNLNTALSPGARQLSIPEGAVRQPDTAGASAQMEYSDKLVGQLAGFGAFVSEKNMADTARVHATNAKIMVQQGKTLKEIQESDDARSMQWFGETATMAGAQAEMVQIASDQFKAEERKALREGDAAQLTPTQYREGLVRRYAEGLDAMPEGGSGRDLLAAMGSRDMADLAESHAVAHYEYKQKKQLEAYTASNYSLLNTIQDADESGDKVAYKQSMRDLQNRLTKPPGMSDESHATVMTGLAEQALREGNSDVYDAIVASNPAFTPQQRQAIEGAMEAHEQRVAERGSIEQSMALAQITNAAANGASSEAIANMVAQYNDKYQRTPLGTGQTASMLQSAANTRQARADAARLQYDAHQALVTGQDFMLSDKVGSANLDKAIMGEKDFNKRVEFWTVSHHDSNIINQQANNLLNPMMALNEDGTVNEQYMAGVDLMEALEAAKPSKAQEVLTGPAAIMYKAVKQAVAAGQDPKQMITVVARGMQNPNPMPAPTKADAKAIFSEEDFGTSTLGDWLPGGGVEKADIDGLRGYAGQQYQQYVSVGIDPHTAQTLALQDARQRTVRVGDKLYDSGGVKVTQFGAPDANSAVEGVENFFRLKPELAAKLTGVKVGTAAERVSVQFVKGRTPGTDAIVLGYVDEAKTGHTRYVTIEGETAKMMASFRPTPQYQQLQQDGAQITTGIAYGASRPQ